MSCITRCVLRWGLIGGLALGGLTLLIGPQRVAAGLAQMRSKAQGVVDQVVEDPVALRHQLQQLADEYPGRIAEVKGELAAVDRQLVLLQDDLRMAANVVSYTTEDLNTLKTKVAQAEEATKTRLTAAGERAPQVQIRFDGVRFTLDEAYQEVIRINTIRQTYKDRLAFEQEQFKMLDQQKGRLGEILVKLEEDFSTYEAQLWALDRQIDALERNDRLIDLMEEQQETLASYDRYERVGNLHQIHARLAQLMTEQEAKMEALQKSGRHNEYETRARMELEQDDADTAKLLEEIFQQLDGAPAEEPAEAKPSGSVAWATPIVIE